ncbi:hypothetical protein RB614_23910 [Phytohabitans sp. ZYX-F-186]|uniref:3-methyl-2-oxobutanoate hydroxymethyltransferase n=1 Tax=Phytohabitans maris TaxID=3071409 RepID=A0ABU0ZKJ0_9ACTN|nr:hypothetical protein [Phytohabitans sp. ZYX-F-186]MDQ7907571.1 hypothetical protein [Phytohabitans sp. ZYX-F-186]
MAEPSPVSRCARAATAKEAAYRIDYPLAYARSTRVVAFDDEAARTVRAVMDEPWGQAQFYSAPGPGHELLTVAGEARPLAGELADSDSVIMVATNRVNAEAVATVGAAAQVRAIMTAGLLMADEDGLTGETFMAIRPYARILLAPADQDDLVELLRAIRA